MALDPAALRHAAVQRVSQDLSCLEQEVHNAGPDYPELAQPPDVIAAG